MQESFPGVPSGGRPTSGCDGSGCSRGREPEASEAGWNVSPRAEAHTPSVSVKLWRLAQALRRAATKGSRAADASGFPRAGRALAGFCQCPRGSGLQAPLDAAAAALTASASPCVQA